MLTRFCVVLDPIRADGTIDDLHTYFSPDDPELPVTLGRTGIASTPVFVSDVPFAHLLERGFPEDAIKTDERVSAAPGYPVAPESDPFGM